MSTSLRDFLKEIERGLEEPERSLASHPIVGILERGELSREKAAAWMAQIHRQTVDITRWVGSVYSACPILEIRKALFHSLIEEETGEDTQTAAHYELAHRAAVALGADPEKTKTVPLLKNTLALINFGEVQLRNRDWVIGFGTMLGFESPNQSPAAYGPIAKALEKGYGLSPEDVQFFSAHVEADEEHGAYIYEVLEKHCDNEERREGVRYGAWTYAELYRGMLGNYEDPQLLQVAAV